MMPSIMSGSLIRDTPPWARMSAGTRSSAITATAPASSAILACSAVTTSMITPPLSISAMPRLTRAVPVTSVECSSEGGLRHASIVRRLRAGRRSAGRCVRPAVCASAWRRTTQMRCTTVTVLATASSPQRDLEQDRQVEQRRRRTVGTRIADQPVGPLGDADLGVVAELLGLAPGRRTSTAPMTRQTRRQRQVEPVCRPARRSRAPARRRARRRAIRSSVESRNAPKSSAAPELARHRAVDQVAEDEGGDHEHALPEHPLREEAPARRRTRRACRPASPRRG